MSLSAPSGEKLASPVKKRLEFKGGKDQGYFVYWDSEQKKEVKVSFPLYIIPVEKTHVIRGWSNKHKANIFSNDVKDLREEELNVRAFGKGKGKVIDIVSGLYEDIKGSLGGGKYHGRIYAVSLTSKGKPDELIQIDLKGSNLGAWIEAEISVNEGRIIKIVEDKTIYENGSTLYRKASYVKTDVREDILEECKEFDRELQEFLGQYKPKTQTNSQGLQEPIEEPQAEPKVETPEEDPSYEDDDLPF